MSHYLGWINIKIAAGFGKLRGILFKPFFKELGKNVEIQHGCLFSGSKNISLGNNVYIGHDCELSSRKETITIGNNVSIAPHVFISTLSHSIYRDHKDTYKPVMIEDNVWIGTKVFIKPGITIGKNAVIGANAVVTKDVPAHTVVGGVPAKIIKNLNNTQSEG